MRTEVSEECRWCGGGPVIPIEGSRLAVCERCGVEATWPRPTAQELDAAYSSWYRPEGGRFSGPGDWLFSRTRGRLASRVDRIAPPGPVLDVGSGEGHLLEAIRATGREAHGIERTDEGEPEEIAQIGSWAAVVFWHSLEHLPDPGERLAQAANELAPSGVLIVAVPNRGSLQATAFGDRWFHLDIPRHLTHLSAESLSQRLTALELRIERTSSLRGGQVAFGWLQGLVGMLPGGPSLYDAIRKPDARSQEISPLARLATFAAAVALLPVALVLSGLEAALGKGGTIYIEARRV